MYPMDRVRSTIATLVADTADASEYVVAGYNIATDSYQLCPAGVRNGRIFCLVDREDLYRNYRPVGHV